MASDKQNRVLVRRGARDLTTPELEYINGAGAVNTLVCTVPLATSTRTGAGDGDACGDLDAGVQ